MQKIVKNSPPWHHCTTSSGYIFAIKAHIDNRKKNLLDSNISPTCLHNTLNFSPLAAEIGSVVWGTQANFKGVSHLGFVAARHLSSRRQPNFAALNRGHHLYLVGRSSRWALAHILVQMSFIYRSSSAIAERPRDARVTSIRKIAKWNF